MDAFRASQRGIAFVALTVASFLAHAADVSSLPPGTPRSTVPILCTDNYLAGRTHARGTGVIADAQGTILTAAHVVAEHQLYCELTVMIPDNDWTKTRGFQVYSVRDCATSVELDLAICHLEPLGRRGKNPLQPAILRSRFPRSPIAVTVTGFSGWGLVPTARSGMLRTGIYLRKEDDCYCDFSMNVTVFEGMSGGPVTNAEGEVIGILTTMGTGKFRGVSFAVSIERALGFLRRHGLSPQAASETSAARK